MSSLFTTKAAKTKIPIVHLIGMTVEEMATAKLLINGLCEAGTKLAYIQVAEKFSGLEVVPINLTKDEANGVLLDVKRIYD